MNASIPVYVLGCSVHENLSLNSSVDIWRAKGCGEQYGKENKKELSSHAIDNYVHPPIYMQGTFMEESGVEYIDCGDKFVLEYTNSTTLQQAWQCGVLESLPISKSAASYTLKTTLMMHLLLLVWYFV
ncbi:hypothetical protein FIM1_4306 [Kluyveromyces marxianus]|uniref:Uncharacterized protein n=1 Tax=Kluyveromyces marxianus TaxID=4911 RepID=A0ABX6EZ89_KLUMA|nr:hypothetical protein FIM1_4306 [Kluyveromyces marxianus]